MRPLPVRRCSTFCMCTQVSTSTKQINDINFIFFEKPPLCLHLEFVTVAYKNRPGMSHVREEEPLGK